MTSLAARVAVKFQGVLRRMVHQWLVPLVIVYISWGFEAPISSLQCQDVHERLRTRPNDVTELREGKREASSTGC